MTFAFWLILILGLMITGVIGKEVWGVRQKLEVAEQSGSNSLFGDSANNALNRFAQIKDQVAGQVLGTVQNLNGNADSVKISQNGAEPPSATGESTGLSAITTRLTQQVTSKVQEFREETSGPSLDTVGSFRSWVEGAFGENPEIRQWLGSLTDEQLEAYTSYLAEFCQDMGFELSWLFEGQIEREPELADALEKIILQYSQASYQAVSTQQEIMAFKALSDYLQDPVSRQNLPLSQKVFGKLIEQGLAPVSISEHLALSNRERKEQITQIIQTIANEYPESFKSILAQTVSEPELLNSQEAPESTHTLDVAKPEPSAVSMAATGQPVVETVPASA